MNSEDLHTAPSLTAAVACAVFAASLPAAVGTVSLPAMSSAGPARKFIIRLIELMSLTKPAILSVYPHHE